MSRRDDNAVNLHATALVVGETGLLVTGASGSGKSTLALALLAAARQAGWLAALVADDQVWLTAAGGRLLAEAPEATAGLIEMRGTGIIDFPVLRRACIHVCAEPASTAPEHRHPERRTARPLGDGPVLPLIHLRHDMAAASLETVRNLARNGWFER